MNKFLTKSAIILFAIIFFLPIESKSQDGFGARGKEFVLAFLPNFHNNFYKENLKMYDSLSLYFVSELPTNVYINFRNRQGIDFGVVLNISDPSKIKEFKLSAYDYELWGLNSSGLLGNYNQCEKIARNTFWITSDEEIIVYAHSQAVTTSESMLVLPTNVLDNYYIVLSYPSDDQEKLYDGKTPSQFVVVATQNNTMVNIKPSAPTQRFGLNEQIVFLNAGEAYLVQARISDFSTNLYDLTGTEVISDKPVSVIAGHQRTSIKSFAEDNKSSSRDFLMEQMTPVKHWGNNATVIPFYQHPTITNFANEDLFRIIASEDNTIITFNKVDTIRLNKKELYEGDLIQPYFIESNKPIFVCSFKKTAKQDIGTDGSISDPLMLANPPMDRVGNFYRFINIQAYEREYLTPTKVYSSHYVGIVVKESGLKTIQLDNKLLDKSLFTPIPNTNFNYANIEVSEGIHEMYCKEPFGILVYGYGFANSYGYIGGMVFKKIDVDAPNLQSSNKCFEVNGVVTDSLEEDSGLISVISEQSTQINSSVTINSFQKFAKETSFTGKLVNIFQDGLFEIIATDSIGFESSNIFEIPGFTVGVEELNNRKTEDIVYQKFDTLFFKRDFCFEFTLENYGKFPQTISKIGMKNSQTIFNINKTAPFTLQPKEKINIIVCDTVELAGEFIDSLFIVGECTDRVIAEVNLLRRNDEIPPTVTTQIGNCNRYVDIFITDSTKTDSGIMVVDFIDSTNCVLKDVYWKTGTYSAILEVEDPYKDAYYEFFTADSFGNNSSVSGNIPGYTIDMYPFENNSSSASNNYDFGKTMIGGLICKEIELYNYGNFTFKIDDLNAYENTMFSIPQSQLPIEIPPKNSRFINVCFSHYKSSTDTLRDTFEIVFNCLKKIAPMEAIVDPLNIEKDSKCNLAVLVTANESVFENYIKQSKPNPASSSVKIEFGLAQQSDVVLSIFNALGELKKEVIESNLIAGKYEFEIDVTNFESGMYLYQLNTNSGIYSGKLFINR